MRPKPFPNPSQMEVEFSLAKPSGQMVKCGDTRTTELDSQAENCEFEPRRPLQKKVSSHLPQPSPFWLTVALRDNENNFISSLKQVAGSEAES